MASVKTAISVSDQLFREAEALAHELGVSRSRLFGLAVEEFIRRHRNRRIFELLNEAYANGPDPEEREMLDAGRRLYLKVLEREGADREQW